MVEKWRSFQDHTNHSDVLIQSFGKLMINSVHYRIKPARWIRN